MHKFTTPAAVRSRRSRPSSPRSDDLTFGGLTIGDRFEWRDTAEIQSGPPGPEPMTKVDAQHYAWTKGRGTAEPHYPVRRARATRRRQAKG